MSSLLIYGYGNPGRADDGLGVLFAERMELWARENNIELETDSNYQLNIEDAERISHFDAVLFADASIEDFEGFQLTSIEPSASRVEFTMHAVSPAFVLDLCGQVYGKAPATYLLHLKGYEWELGQGVSEKAMQNLEDGLQFIQSTLQNNRNQAGFGHTLNNALERV